MVIKKVASSRGDSGVGKKEDGDKSIVRPLDNLELREGELDDVFIQ
jgi:hypothetical protein